MFDGVHGGTSSESECIPILGTCQDRKARFIMQSAEATHHFVQNLCRGRAQEAPQVPLPRAHPLPKIHLARLCGSNVAAPVL